MSDVKPFRGIRPRPDKVREVASPPYDVMNAEEAREMAGSNPNSFLRVVRAEIDFEPDADPHGEEIYARSKANLERLRDSGVMVADDQPCFYVYRLVMGSHAQTGIMLGASVSEYEAGLVKKHEFTRPDKEDDRARHVEVLNANTGPVMLTYKADEAIDAFVHDLCRRQDPVYDFTAGDGVSHTMWVVQESDDVSKLQRAFASVDALYIADGHHRSAASWRVSRRKQEANPGHTGKEPYNYFLSVAFPDDQLQIMGYHRAVKDLNGLEPAQLLEKVAEKFEVTRGVEAVPATSRHFTMYLDGTWYGLKARPGTFSADDPVLSLDVSILQENLLRPLLGIEDPRTDKRVDFIGGIRGTAELERRCARDMRVAFALYPTSVEQLIAIADSGQVMPPKSTWFEPKLRSGMVVRSLDG